MHKKSLFTENPAMVCLFSTCSQIQDYHVGQINLKTFAQKDMHFVFWQAGTLISYAPRRLNFALAVGLLADLEWEMPSHESNNRSHRRNGCSKVMNTTQMFTFAI